MDDALPPWKPTLDAITGARHGGQTANILGQLRELSAAYPHVAEVAYQLAWTYDSLDRAEAALPHYEKAIALGLPPNEHSGALIGLAACLHATGDVERAAATLESGQQQFPEQPEFAAYLALVRHAQGRHREALDLAMTTLLETSEDPGITAHQRTLRHLLSRLD
jgi:Flp pilus assembly protein TadD